MERQPGGWLGADVTNSGRCFHPCERFRHGTAQVAAIKLGGRDHQHIGDLDLAEAMCTGEVYAAAEVLERRAHAAATVFRVAQAPERPGLQLHRAGPARLVERELVLPPA